MRGNQAARANVPTVGKDSIRGNRENHKDTKNKKRKLKLSALSTFVVKPVPSHLTGAATRAIFRC